MENSKFKMGTVTLRKAGSKLNAKICEVFHRYDDGRVNAQFTKADGSTVNLTLQVEEFVNNEEYLSKLDEAVATALLSKGEDILESAKKPLNTWIADLEKLTKVQNEKNQRAAITMVTAALKEYPDSDELQQIEGDVYDWGM